MPDNYKNEIDESYNVTMDDVSSFRENGFIKLKNVFSRKVLRYYGQEITNEVLNLP